MKVRLYARVSTTHQDVDQQMIYLRQWARRNEHMIIDEILDTESGTIPLLQRVQFKYALDNPKGDAMVVVNLDRLSRNWYDENELEKYFAEGEYKLISVKDEVNLSNANGRLMFRIKFAINCNMVEDMKEKQNIGIARAKKEGKFKGRPKGAMGKSKAEKLSTY